MKNEMLNEYGVVNRNTQKGIALDNACHSIEETIRHLAKSQCLSPLEVKQVLAYSVMAITAVCAEETLLRAIAMRRAKQAEQIAQKELTNLNNLIK